MGTLFRTSCSTAEVGIVSASMEDSLLVPTLLSSGLGVSTGLGLLILRGGVALFADYDKSDNAATLNYKELPLLHCPVPCWIK